MSDKRSNLLDERGRIVVDGGVGTSQFEMGLQAGSTPKLWNVDVGGTSSSADRQAGSQRRRRRSS